MTDSIKAKIRTIPHYPKHGIMFRDITSLLKDPVGLRETIDDFAARYRDRGIDKVAGIEARGFILGTPVAYLLGVGFVPIRKKGKLPGATIGFDYELEYGIDRIEVHTDAIAPGERVLLIDDLLATGGTAEAAIRLIEMSGGVLVGAAFIVDLPEIGGRTRLEKQGYPVFAQCAFEGH